MLGSVFVSFSWFTSLVNQDLFLSYYFLNFSDNYCAMLADEFSLEIVRLHFIT